MREKIVLLILVMASATSLLSACMMGGSSANTIIAANETTLVTANGALNGAGNYDFTITKTGQNTFRVTVQDTSSAEVVASADVVCKILRKTCTFSDTNTVQAAASDPAQTSEIYLPILVR
ncbi:MAG: hypothetical protein R3C14_32075 [Caldilineaceae bacterium]